MSDAEPMRAEIFSYGPGRDARRLCRLVERQVAAAFSVPTRELRARQRRSASVALARQSAMYLAHVSLGLNYTQIGQAFKRDRTTAAHACRLVETLRDDPKLDRMIGKIESAIAGLARPRDANGTPCQ